MNGFLERTVNFFSSVLLQPVTRMLVSKPTPLIWMIERELLWS